MNPAVVIYPANVDDIIAVVKHSKQHDLGVAVRTGGHQYSGASSTSGVNIQLDISTTFKSDEDFDYDCEANLLHIGTSFSLLEMNNHLREKGLFLPHGQCVHVHLGGHVQTGGYGQMSRAFGLLSDHVEGFDIVLASGEYRTIWKPKTSNNIKGTSEEEKDLNDDLYWAVLGGSPGNFGILTHIWFSPLHDEDYPDSRGMRLVSIYSKDRVEKVLKVVAEMNDDDDLPRDFDICCSIMSADVVGSPLRTLLRWKPKKYRNIDEKMLFEFPEQYGEGVKWAEEGKQSKPGVAVPAILVYLQWANVKGASETFGDNQRVWFDKMRQATSPNFLNVAVKKMSDGFLSPVVGTLKRIAGNEDVNKWMWVSEDSHTPMSQLTRYWCYEDVREFVKPYEKHGWASNKQNLSTNGWPAWASQRIDEIAKGEDKDMDVVVQVQVFGGRKSMFRVNGNPDLHHGCHSWRNDLTMGATFDCFYQPEHEDPRYDERLKRVLQWQRVNDSCAQKDGIFSDADLRMLWTSYSRWDDPDGGANMYTVRSKYFDSEEKYQKLVEIKRLVDPEYVFTANMFGVDANNAPKNRQILILGRGHDAYPDFNTSPITSASEMYSKRYTASIGERRRQHVYGDFNTSPTLFTSEEDTESCSGPIGEIRYHNCCAVL